MYTYSKFNFQYVYYALIIDFTQEMKIARIIPKLETCFS